MSILVSNLDVSTDVAMHIIMYTIVCMTTIRVVETAGTSICIQAVHLVLSSIHICSIHSKIDIRIENSGESSRWDVLPITQEPQNFDSLCLKMMTQQLQSLLVFTV